MFLELPLLLLFIGAVIVVVIGGMILWGMKHAVMLAINSILGFFALYAVQAWLLEDLVINVWSVLIVGIFGIVGLLVVMLLHWVGVWF